MKFKDTNYGDLSGQTYEGNINIFEMKLTSLEGAPKIVNGYFDCSNNKLTSLKFAPGKVSGNCYCHDNELTTLEGAPKEIGGFFNCEGNKLTSLEGIPKELGGIVYCKYNPNKHLSIEWELRQKNPNLTEEDIKLEMFNLTNDYDYLPQTTRDIFVF